MKNILICILTCFSSLWTQPPYNDRNSLLFLIPPKLKQSQLSSHFDFGVNNQRSLSPSIPQLRWDPWERHRTLNCSPGAAAIWLPTAPGVCSSRCVCVHCCVCVHFGWVKRRAQILSMGHHTWPHISSLLHLLIYAWLRKSFYSRLSSEWGTIQGRFC